MPDFVFDYGWFGWIVYFLVLEGCALFRSKPGDTLSEHVWHWFGTDTKGIKDKSGWAKGRRFVLLAFVMWLAVHFMGGGNLM